MRYIQIGLVFLFFNHLNFLIMSNEKKSLVDFEKTLEASSENSHKVKKFNLDDLTHIKGGVTTTTTGGESTRGASYIIIMDCW